MTSVRHKAGTASGGPHRALGDGSVRHSAATLGPSSRGEAGEPGGGDCSYGAFIRQRNRTRARSDQVVIGLSMGFLSIAAFKSRATISRLDVALHIATLVVGLAAILWSRLHIASYTRWRSLPATLLRLVVAGSPVTRPTMLAICERLGSGALGTLTPLAFLPALVFASHSVRLALPGLGLPLRAVGHVAVQAAALALVWGTAPDLCAALLGGSGSGGSGGTNSTGDNEVEELVANWHSVFTVLEAPVPIFLEAFPPAPCRLGPAHCARLLAFFQLSLGFLLPASLVLASEARDYRAWCARCGASAPSSGNGDGSDSSNASGSRRWLTAVAPAWWEGGRVLQRLLLSPYWLAGREVKLWAHLAVLAAAWVAVAQLQPGCAPAG